MAPQPTVMQQMSEVRGQIDVDTGVPSPHHEPSLVASRQLPPFDVAITTRTFCLVGLVATFLGSLTAFIVAGMLYNRQKSEYDGSTEPIFLYRTRTKEVVSLLLNFYITACTESLGFIHAASLRWALYHEGRLKYNSNLRLFTSAKHCHANGRGANCLWALSLALAYTSVAQSFLPTLPLSALNLVYNDYYLSPCPLLVLGFSLLCQSLLATWCLIPSKRGRILSWNSSPLNTTLAYRHLKGSFPNGFCIAMPVSRQPSCFKSVPHMKGILIGLWSLVPVTILWGIVIWFLSIKNLGQRDTSFSPTDDTGHFSPAPDDMEQYSQNAINVLIIGLVQITYTMAFHAAEQAVNGSRDEVQWRKAANLDKGVSICTNSVTAALTSWKTVTLLILKPIGHWIFSFSCVPFYEGELAFHPLPIFCLSCIALLLSVFVTFIVFIQPTGPQPSVYGNLELLLIFIDDWGIEENGKLYWGDRGALLDFSNQVVRIAGTSDTAENLQPIRMQERYLGLTTIQN